MDNGALLTIGELYTSKVKAPKDGVVLYAFTDSKTVDSAGTKLWRFDGTADIDAELAILLGVDECNEDTLV